VAFIDANKDDVVDGRRLGVEPICRVLRVAFEHVLRGEGSAAIAPRPARR
jgi:hypothetical protein